MDLVKSIETFRVDELKQLLQKLGEKGYSSKRKKELYQIACDAVISNPTDATKALVNQLYKTRHGLSSTEDVSKETVDSCADSVGLLKLTEVQNDLTFLSKDNSKVARTPAAAPHHRHVCDSESTFSASGTVDRSMSQMADTTNTSFIRSSSPPIRPMDPKLYERIYIQGESPERLCPQYASPSQAEASFVKVQIDAARPIDENNRQEPDNEDNMSVVSANTYLKGKLVGRNNAARMLETAEEASENEPPHIVRETEAGPSKAGKPGKRPQKPRVALKEK